MEGGWEAACYSLKLEEICPEVPTASAWVLLPSHALRRQNVGLHHETAKTVTLQT